MTEVKTEVKTYLLNYVCEKCGKGFMESKKERLRQDVDSNSKLFTHECPECGWTKGFNVIYPTIEYEYL